MTISPYTAAFFQTGGSLPDDAPSYVPRRADHDLYQALSAGEFCYVLDSRQVGKSSLMVRTASRLRSEGVTVVILDLSASGQNLSVEQWYFGMLYNLAGQLNLEDEMEAFWENHETLGPAQRWMAAIEELALKRNGRKLVIFLDEIDSVRSLPFSVDELFASIRETYNRRAQDPEFTRLAFCLLGVSTPSDLIRDPNTTPFNIGRRVELSDFTIAEAGLLAEGFRQHGLPDSLCVGLIRRVLYWTRGHPYLTQRLCRAITEDAEITSGRDVDRLCETEFLTRRARETDPNLAFARNVMIGACEKNQLASVLSLYAIVRSGRQLRYDPTDSRADILRLSGLVVVNNGQILMRNRIYEHVFDRRWVAETMPGEDLRRQKRAMRRGMMRASLVWSFVLLPCLLAFYQMNRARVSEKHAAIVSEDNKRLSNRTQQLQAGLLNIQSKEQSAKQGLSEALRKTALAAQSLKLVQSMRTQAEQRLALAQRQVAMEQTRGKNTAKYIDSMSGNIASAFAVRPETGTQGLEYGLRAVEPALKQHRQPTPAAVNGLVESVNIGIVRTLVLRHTVSLRCVTFSPDGQHILTAGIGQFAYVWNAKSGQLEQTLQAQDNPSRSQAINNVEYSADGNLILTASDDGGIRVWNANIFLKKQTKPRITIKTDLTLNVHSALSPDGKWVIATTSNNVAEIHNITNGEKRVLGAPEEWHKDRIFSVAWCHSGNEVVTGSQDGTARVWDIHKKRLVTFFKHPDAVDTNRSTFTTVRFDLHDNLIYLASNDGVARAWVWRDGTVYRIYTGHQGAIQDISSTRGHSFLATSGKDRSVNIWAIDGNGHPLYTLKSHFDTVFGVSFSPDDRSLVTASGDNTAQVWKLTGWAAFSYGDQINHAEFSPDGGKIVAASADQRLCVYNKYLNIKYAWSAGRNLMHAAFAPNGAGIAAADEGGNIHTFHVTPSEEYRIDFQQTIKAHKSVAYMVNWSPDSSRIVSAGQDELASVWNANTGQLIKSLRGHGSEVVSAVFSPEGNRVLTASQDGSAALWDVSTGNILQRYLPKNRAISQGKPNEYHPWTAFFSPNGQYVVTADTNHKCYMWETRTGRLDGILEGHSSVIYSARFSPDGKSIVSASRDGTARIWSVAQAHMMGKQDKPVGPMITISAHAGSIVSASFSPDGRDIVTASADNSVRRFPATIEEYVRKAREILSLVNPNNPTITKTDFLRNTAYVRTVLRDKPSAYYPLDESGSTIAHDLSGNNLNGIMYEFNLESSPKRTSASNNNGIKFDGSKSYISVEPLSQSKLSFSRSFTVEAWVRRSNTGNLNPNLVQAILSKDNDHFAGHYNLLFRTDAQQRSYFEFGISFEGTNTTGRFVVTELGSPPLKSAYYNWYFLTGVYDRAKAQMRFYLDGHQVAVNGAPNMGIPINSGPLYIGRMPNFTYFWDGEIRDVAVYDRALTSEQILKHYKAGSRPQKNINRTADRYKDEQSKSIILTTNHLLPPLPVNPPKESDAWKVSAHLPSLSYSSSSR